MRFPGFVAVCALAVLISSAGAVFAGPGTVWLAADIKSPTGRAEIKLPLEWLASTRSAEAPALRISGVRIDCIWLWEKYQALPAGEARRVDEGTTKEGERFVVNVVSETPAPKPADGKVRILSRDQHGKDTEVGFPLSFARALDGIAKMVPNWIDDDDAKQLEEDGLSLSGPVEFTKLAAYGPFLALDARDGTSRVTIRIE